MSQTGFSQFWIYNAIKIYYKSKNYNIIKHKLPKKESYLNQWNNKRKDQDGMYFFNLQKHIPKYKLAYLRLFSYYYFKDPDFHISTIYHDEFKLWKKYEYELHNLQTKVEIDFLKIFHKTRERKINLKSVFIKRKGFPCIFKLYERGDISIHSLIAFNLSFNIFDRLNVESLNIVEKDKLNKFDIIFNKYYNILFDDFYKDIDWKTILRKTIDKKEDKLTKSDKAIKQ